MKQSPEKQLALAIQITADAFQNDFDKGGQPYILHCLHVMNVVGKKTEGDHEAMAIAVMHDLIEDKPHWTLKGLINLGFSNRVVDGVEAMTHPKDEPYMDYIKRVAKNDDTRIVKMADLKHNSDPHRLKEVSDKAFARIEKYHRAYAYLKAYK